MDTQGHPTLKYEKIKDINLRKKVKIRSLNCTKSHHSNVIVYMHLFGEMYIFSFIGSVIRKVINQKKGKEKKKTEIIAVS